MKLKKLKNRKYDFYKIYDATNNICSGVYCKYKDARHDALNIYQGKGITLEICGYKFDSNKIDIVAKCEDF